MLIAAFRGWNDGGQGASLAGGFLAREWQAERFADLDPENFYDFQATRPMVTLEDGETRTIEWPENAFYFARPRELGRDAILLLGVEPNMRWRTFSSLIVDFAKEPRRRAGHHAWRAARRRAAHAPEPGHRQRDRRELVDELGLSTSRYEGPTGVVGVLHDACNRADIPSVSLWAAVPHYVQLTPSPRAAQALCERLATLLGGHIDVSRAAPRRPRLRRAGERGGLGRRRDSRVRRGARAARRHDRPEELPSGDALAAELTRYLRDRDERRRRRRYRAVARRDWWDSAAFGVVRSSCSVSQG